MIRLNIHEAKTHLSRYLEDLANGEVILLCKRNIPVAEIRGIQHRAKKQPRPIGMARGEFAVPETFFDPLPEETLAAFTCQSIVEGLCILTPDQLITQYPVHSQW